VVVKSCRGEPADSRRELFRDDLLEDGAVWRHAEQALDFALEVGEAAIRAQAVVGASEASRVAAAFALAVAQASEGPLGFVAAPSPALQGLQASRAPRETSLAAAG
jgi:hypothetical protein